MRAWWLCGSVALAHLHVHSQAAHMRACMRASMGMRACIFACGTAPIPSHSRRACGVGCLEGCHGPEACCKAWSPRAPSHLCATVPQETQESPSMPCVPCSRMWASGWCFYASMGLALALLLCVSHPTPPGRWSSPHSPHSYTNLVPVSRLLAMTRPPSPPLPRQPAAAFAPAPSGRSACSAERWKGLWYRSGACRGKGPAVIMWRCFHPANNAAMDSRWVRAGQASAQGEASSARASTQQALHPQLSRTAGTHVLLMVQALVVILHPLGALLVPRVDGGALALVHALRGERGGRECGKLVGALGWSKQQHVCSSTGRRWGALVGARS